MNKKLLWSAVAVVVIIIVIISVSNRRGVTPVTNKEPIKIGAVISLSGFAAPWGEYAKRGIDLAAKNINDAGGIDGRMVQVITEDDHTDGKEAVSAYNKLVNIDHVQGVIGGVFDFNAQPLIPLALTNKIAFISPSNFRIPGGFELNDQSFVMNTDFSKTIRTITPYLQDKNVKNLAVVHFKSSFGNEIAKTLDAVMKENDKSGIINEEYAAIGSNDFRTTIAKLKLQAVDAVFLDMVGQDSLTFVTQAKQLGLKAQLISYNGIKDAFVNEKDKSPLEGIVILNWEINSPAFTKLYTDAYKAEPAKSADKYFDALYVMANALAHVDDKSQAAAYMGSNTFTTPNSTLSFTPLHAVDKVRAEIDIIKNGELVLYQR